MSHKHHIITHIYCIIANPLAHFGKPLAAVGADLSRPHIWKHPRNGGRKCVCGDVEMCI